MGRKLLDGTQTTAGITTDKLLRWREQITKSLLVATTHTATQLVQIAKAVAVCIVDNDGISVGNVDAVLDNRGSHQHIELAIDKVHNEQKHPVSY